MKEIEIGGMEDKGGEKFKERRQISQRGEVKVVIISAY